MNVTLFLIPQDDAEIHSKNSMSKLGMDKAGRAAPPSDAETLSQTTARLLRQPATYHPIESQSSCKTCRSCSGSTGRSATCWCWVNKVQPMSAKLRLTSAITLVSRGTPRALQGAGQL